MANNPSISEFFSVLRRHVLAGMSGALSVPFAGVAAWTDGTARPIFLSLAFAACWYAGYRVWSEERRRVVELEAQFETHIKIAYEPTPPFEFEGVSRDPNDLYVEIAPSTFRYCRFRVVNTGSADLTQCKAQVRRVLGDSGPEKVVIPFSLRPSNSGDEETFSLRRGEERFIDIVAIPIDGPEKGTGATFAVPGEPWPVPGGMFKREGRATSVLPLEPATLHIHVLSDGGRPAELTLKWVEGPAGFEFQRVI